MIIPEPRKLKSGKWFIQLRLGGESISITEVSAIECKRKARLAKAEYQNGKTPINSRGELTLGSAIDEYCKSKSNVLSPSTLRGYKTIRKNRFAPVINKPIKSIRDWQKVINDEAATCSPKTLANSWALIASVLKYCKFYVPDVTLPQVPKANRPWLEPEQVKTFVAAVNGQPCEIPALLALHSLRRSEILALTWENINLKKGTITISGAAVFDENQKLTHKRTNKNTSSARTIPIMIPELKAALKAAKQPTGAICTVAPNTLWSQINRVCERSGLPAVGVHGLRHSFASLAYHLGMSEMETMAIGGWADYNTMHNIYTHLAAADKVSAENKMLQFYQNANKTLTASDKPTNIKGFGA